jgi:predicted lipid-binding transport protein (Tim44 family)
MLIEIIIFAVIALFIVNRYRQVLGTPPDQERIKPRYPEAQGGAQVITLPTRRTLPDEQAATAGATAAADDMPPSLATILGRMQTIDPNFSESSFLTGARAAFKLIVEAFARGDKDALHPLLDGDVERSFLAAIDRRVAAGHTAESTLERIRDAHLTKARLEGTVAYVTVEFLTEQVNVVRDATGTVIEGHDDRIEDVRDIWTFRRDLHAPNPNWELVATQSAGS